MGSLKRCYIIGDPIGHSFSPHLHNTVYRQLGIDSEFTYGAVAVKPEELEEAMQDIRKPDVKGVSVTVPHKVAVMPHLDEIDPLAQQICAVNTIVNENGVLHGYNTDAEGVIVPILKRTGTENLDGKTVLIVGAGGAARAAAFVLHKNGADITVANRTQTKAQELAQLVDGNVTTNVSDVSSYNIIFNATSVGMGEADNTDTPLLNTEFSKDQIVFDAVYAPHETQLLRDARENGAKAIHGLEMLAVQAIGQIKLFTGQDVDADTVMRILEEKLRGK